MIAQENKLHLTKHILLCIENHIDKSHSDEINYIKENFCGRVITKVNDINSIDQDTIIYVMEDIEQVLNNIENEKLFYVIKELSHNYDNVLEKINIINLGQVPINIHNVGVFFRNFFDDKNYFDSLNEEHQFQTLTESNKPGISYRKGIYITKVKEHDDVIDFNLLRCSTNLDGPTDNFRDTDNEIINKVNGASQYFFEQRAELNHVLAQVYNNTKIDGKEKKAKITEHSDKTKDMPRNALIAFCTFYQFNQENLKEIKRHKDDPYNYYYKNASVLTILRFKLKKSEPNLVKRFDVILYPGSVFIMSLSTNRLYTHEIVPSYLPIDKLPTRLGYVIRCSNTKAVFKNNQTYISYDNDGNNELVKMEEPTKETVKNLKDIYFKENSSDELINYGKIDFSLNKGDYIRPLT